MQVKVERLTTEQLVKLAESILNLEGVELGALTPEQTQILQAGAIVIAKAIIAERYTVATLMDHCDTYEMMLDELAQHGGLSNVSRNFQKLTDFMSDHAIPEPTHSFASEDPRVDDDDGIPF